MLVSLLLPKSATRIEGPTGHSSSGKLLSFSSRNEAIPTAAHRDALVCNHNFEYCVEAASGVIPSEHRWWVDNVQATYLQGMDSLQAVMATGRESFPVSKIWSARNVATVACS